MMCTGYTRGMLALNLNEQYFSSTPPSLLDRVELDGFYVQKIGGDQDVLRRAPLPDHTCVEETTSIRLSPFIRS
jgi:hypothetical protein